MSMLNMTNMNDQSQVALVPPLDQSMEDIDLSANNTTQDNREMNNLLSKVRRNNDSEQSNANYNMNSERIEFIDIRDNQRYIGPDEIENNPTDFALFNQSENVKQVRAIPKN